ncbi:histone-lysine N-methyltransferase SETMAR [Trichonephila clavata]|uniref:Histone-lysine N-methyltransferase SETMAR n=1 Tax=Trichonephila clavata TaxID=2740835 RepID=A0A8X6HFP8_TRICU|nr:histone-lysine N-methyltransferase SETMAR [Trichonephila clavata]
MEFSDVSRSVAYKIVTEDLNFKKLCSRWVPRLLTAEDKEKRFASSLEFLIRYDEEGDDMLSRIVTGDETWVSHITPELKQQSMEWRHTSSPSRSKPNKRCQCSRLWQQCSGTCAVFCWWISPQGQRSTQTGHIKSLIFNGSEKTYASCRCSAMTSPSHIIACTGASVGQLLNEEDVVFNLIKQQGLLDIL